ncbi:MAG: ATP-binding cassette domain-containing protein [Taibaiella sp.]|nr:ATP-binding cassette domain-containing protein [Taibaiella sp.]
MPDKKVSTLARFLEILRHERHEISSIYFYSIFAGLVQLSLPLGIQSIISFVLGGAISTSLVLLVIVVILGVFLNGLLQVNQMKIIEKIEQRLFVRYSFQYAHTIPNLSPKEINGYYLPELVNRFFDTISLQKGIAKILLDMPAASIQILFGLILLSFYHPIFIFFGILLLSTLYLILRTTGNRGLETSIEESNYKYKVAGFLQELARVITTFKFSRNRELHIWKTDDFVSGYLNARTAHFNILLFQYWTLIIFKVLIVSAMLIIGGYLLVNQQLNIGQFIAAEIVILMVLGSVEKLIVNLDKVYDVLTSIDKINKVTDKPTEEWGQLSFDDITGSLKISLKDVSFGYDDGKEVLHHVSLEIESGKTVCIAGRESSGKSTLLRLLSGSYKNYRGSIMINGISLSNYDARTVRRNTGILVQVQDIFHGTLRENICVGDDSISHFEMNELAELVGLKSFIDQHAEGYELMLYPTGQHLSAKVIKMILLMRALIHKPAMLLLEEPWLELEEQYAENIKRYLLSYPKDKVLVVVTSDESFARLCDKVIVMEKGMIKMQNSK